MKTRNPTDLFFDQLRDLYSVETQLSDSFPRLVTLTSSPKLRELLMFHCDQTNLQQNRVLGIFHAHNREPGNDKCKAMEGLIEGGEKHLREVECPQTRDLMMIAHCLRVEYYEVAAYGITSRLAAAVGLRVDSQVLKGILTEEETAVRGLRALEPQIMRLANSTTSRDEKVLSE